MLQLHRSLLVYRKVGTMGTMGTVSLQEFVPLYNIQLYLILSNTLNQFIES